MEGASISPVILMAYFLMPRCREYQWNGSKVAGSEVKRGEGGRTGPKPRPQQMLADALGVDVGSIYGNIAVGVYGDVVVEANKQVIIAALADLIGSVG